MNIDEKLDIIERFAIYEMQKWDIWNKGWRFQFNEKHKKNNLGMCYYNIKIIEISYEHAVITDLNCIKDTILHEIAHALSGAQAGHGVHWKKFARLVGAIPKATANISNNIDINMIQKAKYAIVYNNDSKNKLEYLRHNIKKGKSLRGYCLKRNKNTVNKLFYIDFNTYKDYYNKKITYNDTLKHLYQEF